MRELIEVIARPIELGDAVEQVGVSVGMTWSGDDADAALRDADRAMYIAKARAREPAGTPVLDDRDRPRLRRLPAA